MCRRSHTLGQTCTRLGMARQRLCSKPSGVAHRGHARAPVRAAHDLVLVQRVVRLQRMRRSVSRCPKRATVHAPGPNSLSCSSHAGSLSTAAKVMRTEAYMLGRMLHWYVYKGLMRPCCLSTEPQAHQRHSANTMNHTILAGSGSWAGAPGA